MNVIRIVAIYFLLCIFFFCIAVFLSGCGTANVRPTPGGTDWDAYDTGVPT